MGEKKFTEKDIEIAEAIGSLKESISNLVHQVQDFRSDMVKHFSDEEMHRKALWRRHDENSDAINQVAKDVTFAKGIGYGAHAAWILIAGWLGLHK